uniref:Secreted seminal-vesicle Ly-6 protein 1-like n=1 Tax=Bos indicus x Bos taurus TaxID=30522 RepID=A0A4W2H012_BOBOX
MDCTLIYRAWASLVAQLVKNPPAVQETLPWVGKIPRRRAWLQCSCLENPTDRGTWRATVHGIAKNRTRLKRLSMHACIQSLQSYPRRAHQGALPPDCQSQMADILSTKNGTLSYGHQGCSQLCIPMKLFNPSVIVEYKCCHDSPLCNKF